MAKWNEYGLKTGTSARDEVLILDSDTNTNKRITVEDIQEFSNGKMLEKENSTLSTEAKTLIGAINEVDAKNNAQDESLEAIEKKFSSYVKKTDVDSTLSVAGSPADAKVVGERFKSNEKVIAELADKKITKFYASSQGNTHLPDSDKGKIQDMFLYGKSEQVQYKGKNLLNPQAQTQTKSGVTLTANGDGTYTVKGTATEDTLFPVNSIGVEANKTYRLVGCPSGGSNAKYNMIMQDTVNWSTAFDYGSGVNKSYSESYTIMVSIQIKSGVTVNNLIFKPMLTTDTTATYDDFEPYVGGIPSPNPEYPQEIKTVVNPVVKVRGKNLFDFEKFKGTEVVRGSVDYDENGLTLTSTGEDCYTLFLHTDKVLKIPVKYGKTYTLSWKASNDLSGNIVVFFDGKTADYVTVNNANVKKSVFKIPVNKTFITIRFGVLRSGNTIRYYDIQLEENIDSTSYEPYTEQSVTLPYTLYAIPVSTGGNVTIDGQQYVADYVDVERGKLVRMCKEVEYNGDENWELQSINENNIANFRIYEKMFLGFKGLSDKLLLQTDTIQYISREGIYINDTFVVYIRISKNRNISTATEFKSFLSKNPIRALFALSTPKEIDLTPEQIQAYKSLSTNYPVTNIEVSSEQLDGYTIFNYPISMAEGWNYVKQQLNDNRDYIYDMDLQSAEAYVNSEYAVALTELEVM
ncbi:hypothetical protein [Coprococcus comes]|uniref:Uncharacterized protein n=1 Tax=Coprococcus comes TaxID=410072 RepID=A0A3R6D309_9FIRM|nr:hypothetical protein [Coprococcus comes]RHF82015.1 hypothetical protein DW656_12065 [Coprococcus comes]